MRTQTAKIVTQAQCRNSFYALLFSLDTPLHTYVHSNNRYCYAWSAFCNALRGAARLPLLAVNAYYMHMKQPAYYALNPRTQNIELIDCTTGAVIEVHSSTGLVDGLSALVEHTLPTGEKAYLQRGVDPGTIAQTRAYPFSQMTADLICQQIVEGGSLSSICRKEGFPPYHVLVRWKREHPDFADALEEARRDRAEVMRDRAMDLVREVDEDNVNSTKFKSEMYKWSAGVDDAGRYSPKAKVEATINTPTQIIVQTGIEREVKSEIKNITANAEGSGCEASGSENVRERPADTLLGAAGTTPKQG